MRKILSMILALTLATAALPLAFSSSADDLVTKGTLLSDEETAAVAADNDKIAMDAGTMATTNVGKLYGDGPDKGGNSDTRYNLFDDTPDTRFALDQNSADSPVTLTWSIADPENPVEPGYLVLTTGHNSAEWPHRRAMEFNFYGAGADDQWVELAAAGELMQPLNSHAYGIELVDTAEFTQYKLEFQCDVDDKNNRAFQLNDLSVYVPTEEPEEEEPPTPPVVDPGDSQLISETELAEVLFGHALIPYKAGSGNLHIPEGDLGYPYYWDGENTPDKVFDSQIEKTKIGGETHGENQTRTITWETEEAATPAYLVLISGYDTGNYLTDHRNPLSFTLTGYTADGKEVVLVTAGDEMTNLSSYPTGWKIETEEVFVSYKLECQTGTENFQLDSIELYSAEESVSRDSSGDPLKDGRYNISEYANTFTAGNDHGFLDGNLNFAIALQSVTGFMTSKDLLDNSAVYVDGVQAKFNYQHAGLNGSNGYFYGITGAAYTSGVESTVLIQIGDDLYFEGTFTPSSTAVGVEDSQVIYYVGDNLCTVSVTFTEAHGYSVGDTLTALLHDDHDVTRTFTVIGVEGNTVTMMCENFSSSKTLLEFNRNTDTAFSISIDKKPQTQTSVGYVQIRSNTTPGTFDVRALVEANVNYLAQYESAIVEAIFTLADGSTVVKSSGQLTKAWKRISANNAVVSASDDCAWLGMVITNVPADVVSVDINVSFVTSKQELGGHTFTEGDRLAANGLRYDANKIDVYTDDTYTTLVTPDGESQDKLFDGTAYKMGNRGTTVYFQTEEAVTITGLVFTCGNDTFTSGDDRRYMTWTISGKNEAGEWDVVASSDQPTTRGVSTFANSDTLNIDDPSIDAGNRDYYDVEGAGSYSQYKLEFTRAGGDPYTQMAEISLYVK